MANTLTVRKGYIGGHLVEAKEYNGMDSGLSHYTYKGKTYMGYVSFSTPTTTETIEY